MKAKPESISSLEFGPYRIDYSERALYRDNQPLALSPKCFDLLRVLAESEGKLLDKDQLLTEVWPDSVVEENSLAKAVTELRKALGERPGDNRYIATVARRGYRFLPKVIRSEFGRNTERGVTTLAVLPFSWLTHEGSDGPLAIGVADALITRLSNLPDVVIRPTASILKYAGGEVNPASAAIELRADFVISGSLQQSADRVRVTVQLVSADQQRAVWADHFEEALAHVFAIEDAVSDRISGALAVRLTGGQRTAPAWRTTNNNEAWQHYLRGRYYLSKRTFTFAQSAIESFRQALAIDPEYAQAWVGIADALILTGLNGALTGWLPPHETYPEAKRAALNALRIREEYADAHASLGFIQFFYEWDPTLAARAFARAVSVQPHSSNTHHWMAMMSAFLGREQDALSAIERSLQIEPLSLLLNANKGYILYFARRYEDALVQLRTTLELDPKFAPAHHRMALAYAALEQNEQAIRHLEEALRWSEDSPQVLGALGYLYGRAGNTAAAYAILRRLRECAGECYVSAAILGDVHLGLGEWDRTFECMERALQERTSAMLRIAVDPRYDCMRSERDFQRLMKQVTPMALAAGV